MSKPDSKKDGQLKTGTSRRSRSGRAGTRSNTPRIMIVAMIVVVAGGAALFWPRGSSVPQGIGERQTIVASPEGQPNSAAPVHSGEVDINAEGAANLTPEKDDQDTSQSSATKSTPENPEGKTPQQPAGDGKKTESGTSQPQSGEPLVKKPETTKTQSTKTQTSKPKTSKPKTSKPKAQPILPQPTGPYAVQVGAFGGAQNADKEAARLKALGWDARVRAGDNSAGKMVYRVWIGYFDSRKTAQSFISQNSKKIPGAIPVHR